MTEIIINDKLLHLRNDHVSYVIGILEGCVEELYPDTELRRHFSRWVEYQSR